MFQVSDQNMKFLNLSICRLLTFKYLLLKYVNVTYTLNTPKESVWHTLSKKYNIWKYKQKSFFNRIANKLTIHFNFNPLTATYFGICVLSIILGLVLFSELYKGAPKILIESICHMTNSTYKNLFWHTQVYVYYCNVIYNDILYVLYVIKERSTFKKTFM